MTLSPKLKARIARAKAARSPLRPLDQAIANDREQGARVSENAARLSSKLKAVASKKTYVPPRRDLIADRDIFEEIQRSLSAGHTVRMTGRSPPAVTGGVGKKAPGNQAERIEQEERARRRARAPIGIIRRRLPIHAPEWEVIDKIDRARRRRGEREKTFWVPHWDHTGQMLKIFAWSMATWENGGRALTLHIGDQVRAAAERDARGFAAHMRERLKRELRRVAGVPESESLEFFFVVEASELGRPHLHGGITLPDDEGSHDAIRTALFLAGFGRASMKRTGREVDLKPYETPAKWANYSAKWARGSAGQVDGRVFAASSRIRAMGRAWYERMRSSEDAIGGHEPDPFASLI